MNNAAQFFEALDQFGSPERSIFVKKAFWSL
jgi:hypothetical protein